MTDITARALAMQAINMKNINQFSSKAEFPIIGQEGILYIDEINNQLYYWNLNTQSYALLISGNLDIENILSGIILDGGSSSS